MERTEPMLKFKYSAKDNRYTMDFRRDVRPTGFKPMTFTPNVSARFIKRYNNYIIGEELKRRDVNKEDLVTDLDKILDVNIYIMLSRYAQENEEVGYSLRDMYVDDMIKHAMLYRDEERPTSAIGVTYDLRRGPEMHATKSLKRNIDEYTRDARIKNYAKACGEKGIGFAEVIEAPNLLKNKVKEIIDSRKPKMSIAEQTVLKYHQKQEKIEARAAAKAKRRPIYRKQEDNER